MAKIDVTYSRDRFVIYSITLDDGNVMRVAATYEQAWSLMRGTQMAISQIDMLPQPEQTIHDRVPGDAVRLADDGAGMVSSPVATSG